MRETRAVRLVLALACAAALLGLGACGGGGEGTVPEGAVLLRGAGATYPAPLYKAWFETFEDLHRDPDGKPRVVVDYDATGSGTGEKRFLAKAVDFGASDAGWRSHDKELAALDRGARLIPMTAGSVVVIYNLPGFAGDLCFSRQVLADIFLGKIRSWSHPDIARDNPGVSLPKLPITVSTRADGSGTTVAFTNHLSAISEEWKNGPGTGKAIDWPGDALAAPGNAGVAGIVKRTPGAIGYVAYEFSLLVNLPRAKLTNKAGKCIAPTPESAQATLAHAMLPDNLRAFFPDPEGEDAYPIVTFSWIAVYEKYDDAEKAAWLRKLLAWCLTEGQKKEQRAQGYVPLSDDVARRALAVVETIGR